MNDEIFLKAVAEKLITYNKGQRNPATPPTQFCMPNDLLQQFDVAIPQDGQPRTATLEQMQQYLNMCVNTASPRFFNQLFAGSIPEAVAGEWITASTNTSMYTYEMAPVATMIEQSLIAHMATKMGLKDAAGTFLTGGSNGNMMALLCARQQAFPQVKQEGVRAMPKVAIFVSDQAHYSFDKAVNLLGFGAESLYAVKSDPNGSINMNALKEEIASAKAAEIVPLAIVATAGTTVKGAYDPIREMAEMARKNNIWFHVDGSWGGSAILSKTHKHLLDGTELADSIVWNPHKMMNVPLVCSAFLTAHLTLYSDATSSGDTSYIFHESAPESVYDTGRTSLQCGRRNDALKLFFAWRSLGDAGYEKRIDTIFSLAKYAGEFIEQTPELELLSPIQCANVNFRYNPKNLPKGQDIHRFTFHLREALKHQNEVLVNQCILDESTRSIRLITTSADLTPKDIDVFFATVIRVAEALA